MSWLLRCCPRVNLSSVVKKRTYASFSDTITVRAHELDNFLRIPSPGVQTINLSFDGTWPKWEYLKKTDPEKNAREEHCKSKVSRILETLALSRLETILSMEEILQLPIRLHDRVRGRTPDSVFEKMSMSCTCRELGLWAFEKFPSIRIEDWATRQALFSFRQFERANLQTWHAFVESKKPTPLLQAFDFTADFHSRDLVASQELEDEGKTWVDLTPHRKGYFALLGKDIGDLSVVFAQDLKENANYFRSYPEEWKPHLYDDIMKAQNRVSSLLERPSDRGEAARIVLDRPLSEVPDDMRQKFVGMLQLKEDEEVYFEEQIIGKRKKNAKQEGC